MKKLYSLFFFLLLPLTNNPAAYTRQETVQPGLAQILTPEVSMRRYVLATCLHVAAQSHQHMVSEARLELSENDLRLAQFDNAKYPHLAKFFNTHPLPKEFQEAVTACKQDPEKLALVKEKVCMGWKGPVATFNGICIKEGGIDRVLNALCMKNYLQKNDLTDQLEVAEKHLAYLEDGIWVVLAKEIPDTTITKKFTTKMTEAIIKVAVELGFADWNSLDEGMAKNWHHVEGKLVCIDTGKNSFNQTSFLCIHVLIERWKQYFQRDDQIKLRDAYTAARADRKSSLPCLHTHADPDNNFSQVAQEFYLMTQQTKGLS